MAIYGTGPVGLMAAYSAKLEGAAEIYVVDRVRSRLELAEEHCDATPINFEEKDPVEQIKDIHGGGVDKGIDAVGYQAIDPAKEGDGAYDPARENPAVVINDLLRTVRATGEFGILGLTFRTIPVRRTRWPHRVVSASASVSYSRRGRPVQRRGIQP